MHYHLTEQSSNSKLGLGVATSTTSGESCPPSCPFMNNGCYASGGPIAIHWRKITNGTRGGNWKDFLNKISNLPRNWFFRHNQAGDLPGEGEKVDLKKLKELVSVIKSRSLVAWTYTHKKLTAARIKHYKQFAKKGFVINASADNLKEADNFKEKGMPTVVVLPSDSPETVYTPKGNKVIVCPNQSRDNVTCRDCQLCMKADRKVIIGFLAHGVQKRKVEKMIS